MKETKAFGSAAIFEVLEGGREIRGGDSVCKSVSVQCGLDDAMQDQFRQIPHGLPLPLYTPEALLFPVIRDGDGLSRVVIFLRRLLLPEHLFYLRMTVTEL